MLFICSSFRIFFENFGSEACALKPANGNSYPLREAAPFFRAASRRFYPKSTFDFDGYGIS
jgi:hypothetical protein